MLGEREEKCSQALLRCTIFGHSSQGQARRQETAEVFRNVVASSYAGPATVFSPVKRLPVTPYLCTPTDFVDEALFVNNLHDFQDSVSKIFVPHRGITILSFGER